MIIVVTLIVLAAHYVIACCNVIGGFHVIWLDYWVLATLWA